MGHPVARAGPGSEAPPSYSSISTDDLGPRPFAVAPVRPIGDDRPGGPGGRGADDQPEMPGAEGHLEDLRLGNRASDGANRLRRRDLVDLADEVHERGGDVGERHEPVRDDEAPREHAVVDDELAHELGERRARPGDPALAHQEPPLALARQQGLAVAKLAHEVEPLAQRLHRVEEAKALTAHPGRDRAALEGAGEGAGPAARRLSSGMPSGSAAVVSTGLPKVTRLATPSLRRSAAAW